MNCNYGGKSPDHQRIYSQAKALHDAGFWPIPVHVNISLSGGKSRKPPASFRHKGKTYSVREHTTRKVDLGYGDKAQPGWAFWCGSDKFHQPYSQKYHFQVPRVAVLCGKGDLCCLDIEPAADVVGFFDDCSEAGLMPLVNSCYIEESYSKGLHLIFRSEYRPGNVIAKSKEGDLLAEYLSEGQYVMLSQSDKVIGGDLLNLPTLTQDQVESLLSIMRKQGAMAQEIEHAQGVVEELPPRKSPVNQSSKYDAFGAFCEKYDPIDVLVRAGFRVVFSRRRGKSLVHYVHCPGATHPISGNVKDGVFVSFSGTCEAKFGFEKGKGYNAVQTYAKIFFGGSLGATSRDLHAKGFGGPNSITATI